MFRDATATSFAVLTPEGPSDHAGYTEVLVIEFPQLQQLVNDCLLLSAASKLRHVSRISDHAGYIEVCTKSVTENKKDVENRMRYICG